ncbi:hypothetical protein FOL47_007056 [Perkinsus chesapeaki]|uniref:Peptidase C19 ubiquitin carboxyl-terminal hydrolase domain-containing protein n=1 Tax=Perkinsus chesapeaki TaxID=330153 RepID=A0A7J6LN43_PERCH|nr:hypothetical protein FOL47_007056 [Perkinsus chesapeaki]
MSGTIASSANAVSSSVTSTKNSAAAANGRPQAGAEQNGFAPLRENEVELVIKRFWRDTRPRVCVRSDVKNVRGFNFRLLVWPQGSKSSHNHLSAFVEVVPPQTSNSTTGSDEPADGSDDSSDVDNTASRGKRAKVEDIDPVDDYSSSDEDEDDIEAGKPVVTTNSVEPEDKEPLEPYPPDWCCPCVYYKISVMNTKHKWPYTKTDTWTFSYVCPDRGWHTLLDTRFVNRRDGYLSSDGTLVIRASVYPRFAHPLSVGPLTRSMTHDTWSRQPLSPEYREALWAIARMEEEEEEDGVDECDEGEYEGDEESSSSSCSKADCDCDLITKGGTLGGPLLSNVLATDHINSLLQSLFYIPAVRKVIYGIETKPTHGPDLYTTFGDGIPDLGSVDAEAAACIEERMEALQSIEDDLEGVCGDLRMIMELVTGKSEYARVAERELLSSQRRPATPPASEPRSGSESNRRGAAAAKRFDEMERHLLGRFRKSRVVIEQLMEIVDELLSCEKRRISHPRFGELQKHQLMLRSVMRKLNKCVDYMLQQQQLLRDEIAAFLRKKDEGLSGGEEEESDKDEGDDPDDTPPAPPQPCLIRELQLLFARMEMQQDASGICRICEGSNIKDHGAKERGPDEDPPESDFPIPCTCQVIDTSGVIKALGLNGPNCSVSPERIYSSFFDKLQKHASLISKSAWERLADLLQGWAVYSAANQDDESKSSTTGRGNNHHHNHPDRDSPTSEAYSFSHLRFNNGKSSSIEKHLSCWTQNLASTVECGNVGGTCCGNHGDVVATGGEDDGSGNKRSCQFISIPPILHLQFINKIKERLDISEQLDFSPYMDPVVVEAAGQRQKQVPSRGGATGKVDDKKKVEGDDASEDKASLSGSSSDDSPAAALSAKAADPCRTSEFRYRLHSVTFCTNVCGAADTDDLSVGHYYVLVRQSRRGRWCRIDDGFREVLQDGFHCSEWVFSPDWACVGLCYVREDQEDRLYERGVDFRHIRPSLFADVNATLPRGPVIHKVTSSLPTYFCTLVAREHALHPSGHSPLLYDQLSLAQARAEQNGQSSQETVQAAALAAAASASMQIEVTLVTEGQLTNVDGYYLNGMFPHKGRKFLVRKDIPVERLMKAVEEHFKIPKHLQRLFALRYYADTHQERFELMTPSRMIASYMPSTVQAAAHQAALANQQQGSKQQKQQQSNDASEQRRQSTRSDRHKQRANSNIIGHVVVLCMMKRPTATKQQQPVAKKGAQQSPPMVSEEATVWVKFVHPKSLRLVSIGLMTFDVRQKLRDYFPAVRAKIASHTPDGATIAESTDADAVEVWEEVNVRESVKRDVNRTVKEEKIIDGDILIFMSPGTIQQDSVHEETPAPPPEAAVPDTVSTRTAAKRKILVPRTASLVAATTSSGTLSASQLAATLGAATPGELRVAERYIAEAAAKLDDAMEGLCKEHQRQLIPPKLQVPHKAPKKAATEKNAPASNPAPASDKAKAGPPAKSKIIDSGWHVTRTSEGSVLTGPMGRQLTPEQLIDSASVETIQEHVRRVVQGPRCFKCDMPLGTALHPARVRCSEGCHPERAFHDMCIQNLVRDRQNENCVYTNGCSGKLVCTPRHVVTGLVKKDARLSMNVLKQKFTTVLPTPQVMAASGAVSNAPPLPAQIEQAWAGSLAGFSKKGNRKKGSKKKGSSSQHGEQPATLTIPKDQLWWHACIQAWGSVDDLNKWMAAYCASSEPDAKQWQQNTVSRAKSIYAQWLLVLETRIAERDRKRALELAAGTVGGKHQTVQQPQARKAAKKKKTPATAEVAATEDEDDASQATSGHVDTASGKGTDLAGSEEEDDSELELIVHSGKYKQTAAERAASLLQPPPAVEPPAASISPTEAAQRSADMAWCAVQSKKKRHQQILAEQKAKQAELKKAAAKAQQKEAAKPVAKAAVPPAAVAGRTPEKAPAKKVPPPITTTPASTQKVVTETAVDKKKAPVKVKADRSPAEQVDRPETASSSRRPAPQPKQPAVPPPPSLPPLPPQRPPVRVSTPRVSAAATLPTTPLAQHVREPPATAPQPARPPSVTSAGVSSDISPTRSVWEPMPSPEHASYAPFPNTDASVWSHGLADRGSVWGPPSTASFRGTTFGGQPAYQQQQQPATPSAASATGSARSAQPYIGSSSPLGSFASYDPRTYSVGMDEGYDTLLHGRHTSPPPTDESPSTMFQVRVKNLMPEIRRFALPADKLFVSAAEEGEGACVMVRCPLDMDCEWQRQALVNSVGGRLFEMYVTPITDGSGSGPSSATALQWFLRLNTNVEAQHVRSWVHGHHSGWQVTIGDITDCSVYGFNPNACPISGPSSPIMSASPYWVFGDDLNDDFASLGSDEDRFGFDGSTGGVGSYSSVF